MKLEEKINSDLKQALKDKKEGVVSTLRMLKAAIESLSIERKRAELKDEDVAKLVRTQIRRRKESIEQFTKGKREDLAEKEKRELDILKVYMPEELGEEELKKIAREAIAESGAASKSEMGKVMKVMMGKVKGRADGKTVSSIVSGLLK